MEQLELDTQEILVRDNPLRSLTKKEYAVLKEQIMKDGLLSPISVLCADPDEIVKRYFVIDGHHRLKIAKELGWSKVPVYIRHNKKGYKKTDLYLLQLSSEIARRHLKASERHTLTYIVWSVTRSRNSLVKLGDASLDNMPLNTYNKLQTIDFECKHTKYKHHFWEELKETLDVDNVYKKIRNKDKEDKEDKEKESSVERAKHRLARYPKKQTLKDGKRLIAKRLRDIIFYIKIKKDLYDVSSLKDFESIIKGFAEDFEQDS